MRGKKAKYIATPDMLQYCKTKRERKVVETRLQCQTNREVSEKLGIDFRDISKILKKVYNRMNSDNSKQIAGNKIVKNETHKTGCTDSEIVCLPKYAVKGESILYDKDGEIKLRWVKTKADEVAKLAAYEQAVNELIKKIEENKLKLDIDIKEPQEIETQEAVIYPIGDMHIGMFSWFKETGEDYDLKIAHDIALKTYKKLVRSTPATEIAFLINLGDFFHIDNVNGVTQRSGNRLDFDTRWPKILETGLRIMVEIIYILLQKHKKVIVRNAIGNHDPHSTIFLNSYIKAWFNEDPRVQVEDQPTTFWYYRWNKNLIGVTHGDTVKLNELPEIMAADVKPEDWAFSKHRYWLLGHVHHQQVKEFRTCKVYTFGTIAAKDQWHHASGYRSERGAQALILDAEHGIIQINEVKVDQLYDKERFNNE